MAVDPKGKDVRNMPAGDERRDQIKANEDALAKKAEVEFANQGAIDPSKMKIENEVVQHLGANSRDPREWGRAHIRNALPDMEYLWVREEGSGGPDNIAEAENRFADILPMEECEYNGILWHGYQLVQGDEKDGCPEAKDRMDERRYRKLSDTILFRAPKVLVEKWQHAKDIETRARELSVGEGLMAKADEIARRHNVNPSYVLALAGNMEPGELRRLGRQNLREMAQKNRIIADLRAGTVPQMEIARK